MKVIYLIDFDGTISKTDTLDFIAKRFFTDKYREWGRKIMNKEYSIREWLSAFEESFNVHKDDYDKALDELGIDESFIEFISRNDCAIVSGGFSYNIKRILNKYIDSDKIDIYANKIEFLEDNRAKIDKLYTNESCDECAVCKTTILLQYREKYDKIIFIGDGITDVCVAQESDEIYAKRGLYLDKYLTEKKINHFIFDSFSEIK